MMATLDISIVNSALPTIQGEIGASGTEGNLDRGILSGCEIIIPLAAWLERLLGLRTLLLVTMPHQKPLLSEFWQADWLGIAGMALGLGGLTLSARLLAAAG